MEIAEIKVAVDDYHNDIVYAEYPADLVESRVLKGDVITFMGTSVGVITFPSVRIEKIVND